MRKKERAGISKIEQLKADIKRIDTETAELQIERDKLQCEIAENHKNYKAKLAGLKAEHEKLVEKLAKATQERVLN